MKWCHNSRMWLCLFGLLFYLFCREVRKFNYFFLLDLDHQGIYSGNLTLDSRSKFWAEGYHVAGYIDIIFLLAVFFTFALQRGEKVDYSKWQLPFLFLIICLQWLSICNRKKRNCDIGRCTEKNKIAFLTTFFFLKRCVIEQQSGLSD